VDRVNAKISFGDKPMDIRQHSMNSGASVREKSGPFRSSGKQKKIGSFIWMIKVEQYREKRHNRKRAQWRHAAAASTPSRRTGEKQKRGGGNEGQPGRKKQDVDAR
jgi:hypothetical protein